MKNSLVLGCSVLLPQRVHNFPWKDSGFNLHGECVSTFLLANRGGRLCARFSVTFCRASPVSLPLSAVARTWEVINRCCAMRIHFNDMATSAEWNLKSRASVCSHGNNLVAYSPGACGSKKNVSDETGFSMETLMNSWLVFFRQHVPFPRALLSSVRCWGYRHKKDVIPGLVKMWEWREACKHWLRSALHRRANNWITVNNSNLFHYCLKELKFLSKIIETTSQSSLRISS